MQKRTPKKEADNKKALTVVEAMVRDIAYGNLTLKIQNGEITQLKSEKTVLISEIE